jgi:hypothetical protein
VRTGKSWHAPIEPIESCREGAVQLLEQEIETGVLERSGITAVDQGSGRSARPKIIETLSRPLEGSAAFSKGSLFEVLLKVNTGKRVAWIEPLSADLFQAYIYDKAAVGEATIAGGRAPAVHHLGSRRCAGRRDESTRTHTKRKDTARAQFLDQTIRSGPESRVSSQITILLPVNPRLRVFDPHPERKRFQKDPNAVSEEPLRNISSGMPRSQDHTRTGKNPTICQSQPADFSGIGHQIGHAIAKDEFDARSFEMCTHRHDDIRKSVCPDMGPGTDQDLWIRSISDEITKDLLDIPTLF